MNEGHPEEKTPKPKHHDLTDAQLERQLRDTDLTKEEYDSLVDEAKRRRRVDGSGDSLFDNIYSDEP
jgi:hypothetical protein